jgi:adenosylcobinamide-phosphate synthase
VETLAENFSDGIVAPLFYAMIGGAPLALLYKAVNTMDSMVGYKNDRYKDFGYYPAKLDDLLNWIPARLTWLIMLINGFRYSKQMKSSIKIAVKDRKNHSSPNAGFPEAAMAGILQVRLGGPNLYNGVMVEKPYINENGEPAETDDIGRAWKLVFSSAVLSVILFILLRIVFRMFISV